MLSGAIELEYDCLVAVGREGASEAIGETEDAKEDTKDFMADVVLVNDEGVDMWVDGTVDEIDSDVDVVIDAAVVASALGGKVDFVVNEMVDVVSFGAIDV